jgi:glycosyltransferase involved in cell wall biosynthesis
LSRNLKITIVTGAFLPVPPGPAGAVEKIWARLAREFAHRGHSVTLLSRKHKDLAENEIVDGVRYIRKSGFAFTQRRSVNMIRDLCYALSTIGSLPESQITITNTFFLPVLTTLFPKRFGKTVVDLQRYPKGQLWLYSRCGRVRAPSKAILDAAVLQYPSAKHMLKTIPNPVDVGTFFPPTEPRTPAAQGAILFTGRIPGLR